VAGASNYDKRFVASPALRQKQLNSVQRREVIELEVRLILLLVFKLKHSHKYCQRFSCSYSCLYRSKVIVHYVAEYCMQLCTPTDWLVLKLIKCFSYVTVLAVTATL
jgi:hypothetical protein